MVYFFLLMLLALSVKPYWQRYKIRRWQNRLQVKKHLAHLNQISAHINGFELSRITRQETDAYEYVYGEIDSQSLLALLSLIPLNSNSIFYDLGSGSGKTVLACAMAFKIKKAYGIELFPLLDQAAKQQLDQLKQIPGYQESANSIEFVCANFLDVNLADATVIFISATGLFGDIWLQINRRLEALTQCPIIITTTKKLLSPCFMLRHQTQVQMSWGTVDAYIQQIDR